MAFNQTENKIFVGVGLDFETSGLDCSRHACTQLCLHAIRLDTLETMERYTQYISPYHRLPLGGAPKRKVLKTKHELEAVPELMEYDPVALEYTAITMEMLYSLGIDLVELAQATLDFFRRNTLSKGAAYRPVLIGHNIPFDTGFLQQLMCYAGLMKEFEKVVAGSKDFYGNFQPVYVDTLWLARMIFAGDPGVHSYKLEKIAELLGVDLDDAHDADADVTATLNVFRVGCMRMRNRSGSVESVMDKKEKTRVHFKI